MKKQKKASAKRATSGSAPRRRQGPAGTGFPKITGSSKQKDGTGIARSSSAPCRMGAQLPLDDSSTLQEKYHSLPPPVPGFAVVLPPNSPTDMKQILELPSPCSPSTEVCRSEPSTPVSRAGRQLGTESSRLPMAVLNRPNKNKGLLAIARRVTAAVKEAKAPALSAAETIDEPADYDDEDGGSVPAGLVKGFAGAVTAVVSASRAAGRKAELDAMDKSLLCRDIQGRRHVIKELREQRHRAVMRGMDWLARFLAKDGNAALYAIGDDAPSVFFEIWYTSADSRIRCKAKVRSCSMLWQPRRWRPFVHFGGKLYKQIV